MSNDDEAKSATKHNILVIEDDEAIRDTLQYALEMKGYGVITAENGKVALETLQTIQKPCLILLDLMMPIMNGWEFVEAMKKHTELLSIPVLIVTAFADNAKTIHSNGVLKKPIDLDVLFKAIEKWCGNVSK